MKKLPNMLIDKGPNDQMVYGNIHGNQVMDQVMQMLTASFSLSFTTNVASIKLTW